MREARLACELCISAAVRNRSVGWRNHPPFQRDHSCLSSFFSPFINGVGVHMFALRRACICLCLYLRTLHTCIRMCTNVQSYRAGVQTDVFTHTCTPHHTICPPPLSPLFLSSGPFPPFSPSHPPLPPMCPRCPNPFPGRKALIEGAGFSLWPVGAHYCVFISK